MISIKCLCCATYGLKCPQTLNMAQKIGGDPSPPLGSCLHLGSKMASESVGVSRSFQEAFGELKHALSGYLSAPLGFQSRSFPLESL